MKRNRLLRPHLAVLTTLTLAVATLTACGGDEAEGGPDKVAVGVIPIVDVAPIYLGQQQGFFASRGIELNLVAGQGGSATVSGVLSGEFQFGFSNVTSLLLAAGEGVPLKVVANGVASTGEQGADFSAVMVKGDSPIQGPADLSGKTVAVNTLRNIGETTVRESIRKAGGDPTTVEFTELGFPQMAASLDAGDIDAAWVVEPFVSTITAAGGRAVAWNYADAAPDLTVALYFTSAQLAAENPDLAARFTAAVDESLTYASANPDAVREILGTYTQIGADIRAAMVLPEWPTEINRASIETLLALGKSDGIITTDPDLDALLP